METPDPATASQNPQAHLEHLNRVLRAIRNINQLINRATSRAELLQGACEHLTESRGYHSAWIALLDAPAGEERLYAAGLGNSTEAVRAAFSKEHVQRCRESALKSPSVVCVPEEAAPAAQCPLHDLYATESAMCAALRHHDRTYGILAIALTRAMAADPEEQDLFAELADDLGYALHGFELEERQQEATAELAEADLLRREAIQAANVGLWSWILATNEVRYSPEWKSQLGYEDHEIGNSFEEWRDRLHPADAQAVEAYVRQMIKERRANYQTEFRMRHKDGTYRNILAQASVLTDAAGEPTRVLGSHVDVTERKTIENALAFQAEILSQIQDYVTVTDLGGRITYVNDQVCRVFCKAREELIGTMVEGYGDDPRRGATQRQIVERTLHDGSWRGEVVNRTQKGDEVIMDCRTHLMRDEAGQPIGLCGVSTDITDRKRAEDRLRQSEEAYRNLFDNMLDGFAVHEIILDEAGTPVDYRFLSVNPAFESLTGLAADKVVGKRVLEVLPDTEAYWIKTYGRVALTGEPGYLEQYSQELEKYFSVYAFRPEAGRFACVIRDITARTRAEQELRESEKRYRALYDNAPLAYQSLDREGRVIDVNPTWLRTLGYEREEVLGRPFPDFLSPEWREGFRERFAGFIRRGQIQDIRYRMQRKDGTRIEVSFNGCMSYNPDGSVRQSYCVFQDITERVRAEEALRDSEEHFRNLFESMSIGVAVYEAVEEGEDFVFVDINAAGERFSKVQREAVRGHRVTELFPSVREIGLLECFRAAYRTGKAQHLPMMKYHDDRIEQWVENSVYRLPSGLIVAIYDDRSEEQRLQRRLRQMEKMDAIGQLAGGVAHDFNNQLAGIMGYGDMLLGRLTDPKLRRYAEGIVSGARHAADLTRQLLAFARKGQYRSVTIDLHATIEEVVGILRHTIDKRIRLEQVLRATPACTKGDPSQIQNALLNLALNARDAMPEGGTLTFETDRLELDDSYCESLPYRVQPGPYVRVAVSDTGCGMDEETRKRAFEPFFTTKEVGKGTGMGLAAVYGTVKNHGGAVNVYSEPGRGSVFRVYLPLLADGAELETREESVPARLGQARILVVDDESLFRKLAEDMLTTAGFEVVTRDNGADGLAYFTDHWREIDLVLLDMVMPRMDGQEAFRAMRAVDPEARIVLCSGYSLNGATQELTEEGVAGFLEKPFRQTVLLNTVVQVLDEARRDKS